MAAPTHPKNSSSAGECDDLSRRTLLQLPFALPLAGIGAPALLQSRAPHIVVVGAGAFGGWTALQCLRQGARVTLVDAWGPAHPRASSGGETRVIRGVYGNREYVQLVVRAFELWRDHERRSGLTLYHRIGAMWMVHDDEQVERRGMALLRDAGLPVEELSIAAASRRYPQVRFDEVRWVLFEPEAGYLLARRACESVLETFRAEGGTYLERHVTPGAIEGEAMQAVRLSDGSEIRADHFVFACGPWLGQVFPDLLGGAISPTRQEVFFFGPPAGDHRFTDDQLPVWIEHRDRLFYGIPGNRWRGFKVADDTHGPALDPTTADRRTSDAAVKEARALLARRFPALANAPVIDARVCQYENSPDGHFILDRHPGAGNVWIVGGGSGHGFKFGPALGEKVASLVLGRARGEPLFTIARLRQKPG